MPAKHYIDNEAKIIFTTWEGAATNAEFINALKKYQKDIQCNLAYIDYNEIFDFSNATLFEISINGMLDMGRIGAQTDHLFTNKKLALVVGSYFAFGTAKLYETYRNLGIESSKEIRVFKDRNKAIIWAQTKGLK